MNTKDTLKRSLQVAKLTAMSLWAEALENKRDLLFVASALVWSVSMTIGRFLLVGPDAGGFTVSGTYEAFAHLFVGSLMVLSVPKKWLPDRWWPFLALTLMLTAVELFAFFYQGKMASAARHLLP